MPVSEATFTVVLELTMNGIAIAGLGSDFMYGIKVDLEARLDIEELRKELQNLSR